jgi:hypothetical protein
MKKLGFNELNVALLVILEPAPLNFLELYSAWSRLRILKSVERLILQWFNMFPFSASVTARSISVPSGCGNTALPGLR